MHNSEFDAFTEHYRKGASRILANAQCKKLFLLRLEQVNVLVRTHLTKTLGPKHVDSFREFNKLVISNTSNNEHDLAVLGVRRVLNKLDLEMLAYLDINRAPLIADFEKTHTLKDYETLPQSEKDTVDHVTTTILGYLKLATCKNHSQLSTEQIEQQAEAKLLAKYQAKAAFKATLATDEAVAATELPQDLTALGNFVQDVVDKDKAKSNKPAPAKKRPAKDKDNKSNPNKKVRILDPKDKAGQKKVQAKATTTKGDQNSKSATNSDGDKRNEKGNKQKKKKQKKKKKKKEQQEKNKDQDGK
jgi:hypothetical protein